MLVENPRNIETSTLFPTEFDHVFTTVIPGLVVVEKPTHMDDRGFFREIFRMDAVEKNLGYQFELKQPNHSRSAPGVLRGFHGEPWTKITYCSSGNVFTAVVDVRQESPTFGKVFTMVMGDTIRRALVVPRYFLNSFISIGPGDADYIYLTDEYWSKKVSDAAPKVIWNDPTLNVKWPILDPVLSNEDVALPKFKMVFSDRLKTEGEQ